MRAMRLQFVWNTPMTKTKISPHERMMRLVMTGEQTLELKAELTAELMEMMEMMMTKVELTAKA